MMKKIYTINLVSTTPIAQNIRVRVNPKRYYDLKAIAKVHPNIEVIVDKSQIIGKSSRQRQSPVGLILKFLVGTWSQNAEHNKIIAPYILESASSVQVIESKENPQLIINFP